MSEDELLDWEIYPKFDNIQTDSGSTKLIGFHKKDPEKEIITLFDNCKKYFPNSVLKNPDFLPEIIIYEKNKKVATIVTCFNCLTIRFFIDSLKLTKILNDLYFEINNFFVKINHKDEIHELSKSGIIAKSKSGYCQYLNEDELFSFWKFYIKTNHVADLLMGYSACEMGECTSTILMFEVFPEFRGKGLGRKIISEIEYFCFKQGFLKLRLDNTQSIEFWEKLGYKIDLDEGEKDLTHLNFGN